MKFRWKLMGAFMVLVGVMTLMLYLLFDRTLNGYAVDEAREQLSGQVRLARLLIERENSTDLQLTARRLGEVVKARVTILTPSGVVVGDSEVDKAELAALDNHSGRPEIQQAAATGVGAAIRYSSTLRTDLLYSALSFTTATSSGFVRLAVPLTSLSRIRSTLHGMIGGAIALAVPMALLFSYILSRIILKPLETISVAADRIGKGETDVRIPVQGRDEVGALAHVMNDMSGRIREQMQRMAAEKQQLDAILHGMGEGVMVLSEEGVITLVNPTFRSMFSVAGEVVGQSLIEISRNPELLEAYREQQSAGELLREISLQAQGRTLLTHWVPLKIDGTRCGVVAVFHDISEMKKTEQMRRDFVANVSHELRTPVTIIKGYAETLLDGALESDPERARRFTEIIYSHAGRLTLLITDLLALSRLEVKGTALTLSALDPRAVVDRAVTLTREQALERQIDVAVEIPIATPQVLADAGSIEQVLVNLLDNAIKYTPHDGKVRVSCADEGECIRITVADSGIGIPAKDQARIFERFYRVDEARSREQGGTGLGLAIVKHIVQLHNSEISVTSEPGHGSVFTFTLKKA